MTIKETSRYIRHELADLVTQHGQWNGMVDYAADELLIEMIRAAMQAAYEDAAKIAERLIVPTLTFGEDRIGPVIADRNRIASEIRQRAKEVTR